MDFLEKSSLIIGYLIQGMTQACKNYIKSFVVSKSSRCDTGLMHDLQLTWASGESETKGKGRKCAGATL